ncbi:MULTISPECIES: phosphotransferase [unclassified Modicisalibacter]|uniref:aminoglycoside phosphotransferase family protein n=1 Tax=unclassified Modicisalibacter TaxID=2679913 RepID=UPI001CCA3FF0|nr:MULTISPECIES: phosphotransferase [unclassified Modicisalibacter]MBZ9559331.1 phosphotransferase [Modicisalibacter sp. R2A 31.J]MBZ9576504.1 phosphotransferase [Modicisalibacter sp. MOD 31.J]
MSDARQTTRLEALRDWAGGRHQLPPQRLRLELAAGDASFRRYYRLWLDSGETRIVMDAPPDKENSRPFVAIAEAWRRAGLAVPALHAVDLEAGFIELEDLGDTPLHTCLGADTAADDAHYDDALALLAELQNVAPAGALPDYDAALLGRELDLFPEWCLGQLLALPVPAAWPGLRARLIDTALTQPRVTVHRDYDAMNLMCHRDRLWLIDFQDAVHGPLSYDLISLLRGRYRRLPREAFRARVEAFRRTAVLDGRLSGQLDAEAFLHQADAMAAQRSLKVLGIFCRLTLRDARAGYLARLPHFLDHLRDSLAPWPAFAAFTGWLESDFAPALERELAARGEASS